MSSFQTHGYRLGMLFGLKPKQVMEGVRLYNTIITHDLWNSKRSRISLMTDCMYLMGKKYETGITIEKAKALTREEFGVETQPRPNTWSELRHAILGHSESP